MEKHFNCGVDPDTGFPFNPTDEQKKAILKLREDCKLDMGALKDKTLCMGTSGIISTHWDYPVHPSDCFKIRECPNCKQLTAQEQVSYDPYDQESFLIWKCTMCKEQIDIV